MRTPAHLRRASLRRIRLLSTRLSMALATLLTASGATAEQPPESQPSEESSPLSKVPILRHQLDNGLRVVLSPEVTIPTVGIGVYYDVGSRNEKPGRSGFAHLFEHMMFQGSANVGKGEHFKLIMNRGGSMNGTTNADRTNYFATLPANELALGLWLEADRMKSLNITMENFENQRQTVMEERRQSYENQPYMLSMLRINELAYGDYWPYAHSTIGNMEDLQNAPLEAVQRFFNLYYAPNNAVLSVAGDFDPAEAMRLIQLYFGDIPSADVPPYGPPDFEPPTEERVETMVDPNADLPAFHIAYHIPPSADPDHYPLELLAIVLGDGESSRLYQELVKKKEILREISVATDDRRGPDLFSFWAIVASKRSGATAREAIYEQIASIAARGVTPSELQKAKNRVRASFVFGLQSNLSRAMRLAEFELYRGNAELLRGELDRYMGVTTEDIQRVAGEYLTATNRTVLDVLPKTQAGQEAAPSANAVDVRRSTEQTRIAELRSER